MIHLNPLPSELAKAKAEAASLGRLSGSLRRGGGNLVGILAEIVSIRAFPGAFRLSCLKYDLICRGVRIDVKAKERSVRPLPGFVAAVPLYQSDSDCDAYLFASVRTKNGHPEEVSFCGWIPKREFWDRATVMKRGDVHPENQWVCSMDCGAMTYRDLRLAEKEIEKF